jgi:hypothetical protein
VITAKLREHFRLVKFDELSKESLAHPNLDPGIVVAGEATGSGRQNVTQIDNSIDSHSERTELVTSLD